MKTFGEIRYASPLSGAGTRPVWSVACPPHVMTRLKRVFAVVDGRQFGRVDIDDTPANCRDLLWFLDRFPMEVPCLDHLGARAAEHVRREEAVVSVLSADYVPTEFKLALPLREYQRIAADLALRTGGMILGDDVGLGKTASSIALFADKDTLPAAVVCLAHLPRQWAAEIKKFAPELRVKVARSGKPEDLAKTIRGKPAAPWDVLILSYHKLHGLAETLSGKVRSVVFDECQELRRTKSNKHAAAKHLASRTPYRLGLSATPIYNYGGEIHSVYDVIAPDALGSSGEFLREWCGGWGGDRPRLKDPAAFGHYLRDSGLMLRRTRSEVGRELPRLTVVEHEVDADTKALDDVEDRAAELARIILAQGGRERGEQLRASEELSWRLRQATGIAKARPAADFARMLAESGEKVVLFGWHREVYELWKDRLFDLKPVFYTGEESASAKATSVERFTKGDTSILVMSLRAGAGVDGLQHHCRTVVFGELDWSPGVHEQCIGRVFRDGQPDPVVAYYLVADSGSDPVVADVLGLKRRQIDGLIRPDAPAFERLEIDADHVKRLASDFLARKGLSAEVEEVCA